MIDKVRCDDGFAWNICTCECECEKSHDVGEYLDYAHCKYSKRLMDKLVEKCEEDIVYSATLYDYGFNRKVCKSCMWFAMLLIIEFVLIISVVCWTPSSSLNGPIK